jgi:hypothetical protein
MPFINGRFYANPAYGRALERARRSNSGGVWSEDFPEQGPGIAEEGAIAATHPKLYRTPAQPSTASTTAPMILMLRPQTPESRTKFTMKLPVCAPPANRATEVTWIFRTHA